jgi:hypothetical protein
MVETWFLPFATLPLPDQAGGPAGFGDTPRLIAKVVKRYGDQDPHRTGAGNDFSQVIAAAEFRG